MNKWVTKSEKPIISDINSIHYVGRPCLIKGEKAIFHKFVETEQLILIPNRMQAKNKPSKYFTVEDNVIITDSCSIDKIKTVEALVEFENGDVTMVNIETIQFLDTGNLFHENDIFFRKKEEL